MTITLTTRIKLFLQRMSESDEQAQWGFELLLKRDDFEAFFDFLNDAGLFAPEHSLAPIPSEQPGYVHVPFWYALNYLEAVAKLAGDRNDLTLAQKVMAVVRAVSLARETDGSIRDNYRTYRKFTELLGLVPMVVVTAEDLELIPGWLSSRYDRGLVGNALDVGILKGLLASDTPEDWDKASIVLRHCTAMYLVDEMEHSDKRKKPVTVMDDYWLKTLINHHTNLLGIKIGKKAAEIFLDRVREVYDQDGSRHRSYWSRPAIEDHAQNNTWEGPENRFVEGLRDVLLSWVDHDAFTAQPFIKNLLCDNLEIARRIAIHVLNQRWVALRNTYLAALGSQLFDSGHLHELYGLLREHFQEFTNEERVKTVEAIRLIPRPTKGDDPDYLLKDLQRSWLSAIAGKGYEPADKFFQKLNSDNALGKLQEHPDFHSYMESWTGPGPSQYSVNELLAFAEDGSIVERLNEYRETDPWRGTTTKALVDTLEEAVMQKHQLFLHLLPDYQNAKRPYQYAIISGFKRLWEKPQDNQRQVDWDKAWVSLVNFFETLIEDEFFWTEKVISERGLTPNRDWIPPVIAEFLRAGTRSDEKIYAEALLERTWHLIEILLEKLEPEPEAKEDAVFQAINCSKGKAIEALFSHALRVCRLSDRATGSHVVAWGKMRPVFERELAKCKDTNFEFSTLTGNYIAQLAYLDRIWLQTNVDQIFPQQFVTNFTCALEGLAYAPATRPIYSLLRDKGVLDWALKNASKGRHLREKLIERIALAYLQGEDELDAPRFSNLFESGKEEDIVIASGLFWSIRNQESTADEIERVLCFWERCIQWSKNAAVPPAKLLSSLSLLSHYISTIQDREKTLLRSVASYVGVNYNADYFIEELDRLVATNPTEVSELLGKVLKSYQPNFDFEDKLKSLLTKLANAGLWKEAKAFANILRHLPGMQDFFDQIRPSA